jgi:hypothetical protein
MTDSIWSILEKKQSGLAGRRQLQTQINVSFTATGSADESK